ncbi:2-dehydro-3-deoxygalactonokinase [Sandaracinobacteroides saxicola]|uniref:2-dehydro-3-deoxygalactonokinase n=1 Tax=Sandaracinobacteroides saxicola TaxID=2759707 RepID=UPI0021126938|nr:2-dehydro-3-deoxygalactonokinase [Sandaracinobacteroides saxicola]
MRCHLGDPAIAVTLVGDPGLTGLYARAIAMQGGTTTVVDGETAFLAGIVRLWQAVQAP